MAVSIGTARRVFERLNALRNDDPETAKALLSPLASINDVETFDSQNNIDAVCAIKTRVGLSNTAAVSDAIAAVARRWYGTGVEFRAPTAGWLPSYAEATRHRADHGGTGGGGVVGFRISQKVGIATPRIVQPVFTRADLDDEEVRLFKVDPRVGTVQSSSEELMTKHLPRPSQRQYHRGQDDNGADALPAALRVRDDALTDLVNAPANSRVVPEDFSVQATEFHMAAAGAGDWPFVNAAAKVGVIEGFRVILEAHETLQQATRQGLVSSAVRGNIDFVRITGRLSPWVEDNGELSCDGTVSIPVDDGEGKHVSLRLIIHRLQRLYPDIDREKATDIARRYSWSALQEKYPLAAMPVQGVVAERSETAAKADLAALGRASLRANLSYTEGGNVLTGTLPSGAPYAVVGADSIALTAGNLTERLNREVKDEEARLAIAKDYGVDLENCIVVEQPGDFHIDMSMFLASPGVVVLNDARAAADLQIQWLWEDYLASKPPADAPDVEQLAWDAGVFELQAACNQKRADAEKLAALEDITARDLKAAGLTVHRMAGRFFDKDREGEDREVMNFLNGEGGTGKDGGRFFITQGGEPRAERYFLERVTQDFDLGLRRVYLLRRDLTEPTLDDFGATNCRIKLGGGLARWAQRLSKQHLAPT